MAAERATGEPATGAGAGYWPSIWPVECGGNHRPKTADGPGLGLGPTDRLVATTRHTGRWPVMFVWRNPDQLYLNGTTLGGGEAAAGWVDRVDPTTLRPLDRSGDLPCGHHEWCGSLAVHANGDLYTVNGSFVHRLDPSCAVVAERRLPVDHAHNGLLVLGDGSIVTKDLRLGSEPSTLTVLDPDLRVLATERVPEASMGRLAAVATADGDELYLPGTTRVFRYRWDGRSLRSQPGWRPQYRTPERGGLAGDPTIVDGRLWLHDNGDVPAVRHPFSTPPPSAASAPDPAAPPPAAGGGRGGLGQPAWTDPVRLLGYALDHETSSGPTGLDEVAVAPTELPGGWVLAPPLVCGGVAVSWDTANTGLAAFDVAPGADGRARSEMLWFQPFRSSMQPLVFPATGELVVNDFRYLEDGSTSDDLVVLDLDTGRMKARIGTGASRYGAMFLTPGHDRDLYACTFEAVARIRVEAL